MPASLIGSMDGTHEITTTIVISAQAARIANASRQDIASASKVPAGTPSILATVWPITIMDTACASLPLSASVLAISVAVPKKCAVRQAGNETRHQQHRRALKETALSVIADQRNDHKQYDEVLRRHLAAEHQNQCAEHTPMAYAEM